MPPSKRKGTTKQDKSKKQAKQDGQKAVAHDIDVPVDEGYSEQANVKVYIEDGLIYDASLNQTNIGGNNNKFYRIQVLAIQDEDKFYTHTRWGRVGEDGQVKTIGPTSLEDALKEFDKKFKSKTGHGWSDRANAKEPKKGKYTFIERNYEDDEDEAAEKLESSGATNQEDSKLPIQTQRLMELIFNQNHFNAVLEQIGYNAEKLPLGKLGKPTLKKGFEFLHELSGLIKHPSLAKNKYDTEQKEAIEDFSNKYYSTIPHEFGRSRPPPINNNDILRKEVSMLDTLTDMSVADTIMKTSGDKDRDSKNVNVLDQRFQDLGMEEMTPIAHDSDEYRALRDYLIKSAASHGFRFRLEEIFRIERHGEAKRFSTSKYAKLHKSDRRLLWHGSRTTNYGGILSQGLRIAPPEAPLNGYAFGKGIYLADVSSKSAQYCSAGMSGGTGILMLVEAELGDPKYEIPDGDPNAEEEAKKRKCVSTLGVGQEAPQGWIDGKSIHDSLEGVSFPDPSKGLGENKAAKETGYLQYNEYICYDVAQLRLRYLFRVGM